MSARGWYRTRGEHWGHAGRALQKAPVSMPVANADWGMSGSDRTDRDRTRSAVAFVVAESEVSHPPTLVLFVVVVCPPVPPGGDAFLVSFSGPAKVGRRRAALWRLRAVCLFPIAMN